MKKIRIGNDFVFAWEIERNGLPEDLSSVLEKHLHLSVFDKRVELIGGVDYDITGNVIRIEVTPTIANIIGTYKAEFHYILPDNGLIDEDRKCAVDVDAFQIVAKTAQADDSSEFSVTSDMAIAFKGDKGDSAYQVWLDAGNTGTEEDYFAYLRQPATDAGDSISELEGEIQVNEGLRVQAESERDSAEATRVQSENERFSAETIRQSNEGNRIENEATRVQNEAERISEEGIRQSNETDRVEAESERVQAENERVQAEVERQITIQEAITATNLANEKANLANVAAQNANEAAGLADTARTELTTAVNTKLGEADAKIEEMDTTLSTYDGRVTQVESDISQLAGDVKELGIKDAVQGAKIKDIENVINTMNPNQSAQLSVSGRKIVSLPKNASNGGMSMKLEGLTAENLVLNGDFRDGLNGWIAGVSNNSLENGMLTNTSSGTTVSPHAVKGITGKWAEGHKYYCKCKVRANFNMNRMYINTTRDSASDVIIATIIAPIQGQWYDISAIYSTSTNAIDTNSGFRIIHEYSTIADSAGKSISIEYAMWINLTKTFGSGNEPDVATCDKMFSDYFDGVKSFVPTGRVRSVDKNGLNPTELYLTAPELRSNGTVKDEIRKGANGYELVKRISDIDGTVLATPIISPINYGGILNSAENGTVYHEPVIADAGVYSTNMPILLTDYPISALEEIIIHKDGIDTYLDVSTAVIAPDGLSFTHPDLASGDLVLFTYAYDKESTNGNITATFYDSNVVKIDTVTGKAYRINEVVTNGVLTRTLTEV